MLGVLALREPKERGRSVLGNGLSQPAQRLVPPQLWGEQAEPELLAKAVQWGL